MAAARHVREARFLVAAHTPAQFPAPTLSEIAFAGRSNVGKSSLLNALVGRKALAKVSATPGKTRSINFFDLDGVVRWVDLPGYGYAKVSKRLRSQWGDLIRRYIEGREVLDRVICLSDSRRAPTSLDVQLVEWLDACRVPWVGVLTKVDKLGQGDRTRAIARAQAAYACAPDQVLILCSATTGRGLSDLWPHVLPG